jgi:hypothetical protein
MHRLPSAALLCATLLSGSLGCELAAQTSAQPAANRFVPANSCVVARVGAPARWRAQFEKTQVWKLMHGPTLRPFLDQFDEQFRENLEELRASGRFDADLVQRLYDDYAGDLIVSLQVDWDAVPGAAENHEDPPVTVVWALTPHESYDLSLLAAEIQKKAESETEHGEPLRDLVVGEHRLRIMGGEDGMQATVPAMIDGHLVLLLGRDIAQHAERLLATDKRFEGEIGSQPFFVHGRLAQGIRAFKTILGNELDAGAGFGGMPFDADTLFDWIGLTPLDQFSMNVDADGQHLTTDISLSLNGAPTGLLRAIMLEHQPKLLRLVPPGAEWFSVSAFDPGAIFRLVADIWTEMGDEVPMTWDDAKAAFAEEMKVRLEEDLIAHLGTEVLMVEDTELDAEDLEEMPSALAGSCIGVALRDGKAFGASLETMLRSRGLHASRKSEDYAGTKIYQLKPGGLFELEYAVTDDLLLVVLGKSEGARRNLRAVLDARANPTAKPEFSAPIEKHLQVLPAGWSGLSVTPVGQLLSGFGNMFNTLAMMGEMPDELSEMTDVLTGLGGELQRLGIDHVVSVSYSSPKSFVNRMRW